MSASGRRRPDGKRDRQTSKADQQKEKEMMELLKKLKEASKVPDHAVRRVKRLDELIASVRKAQQQVLDQIEDDEARLADLDRQERDTLSNIAPIKTSLEEREAVAADLRKRLGLASGGVAGFVSESRSRTIKTKKAEATHRKAITGRDLLASRGYDMTATGKAHLQVPQSVRFQNSMKAGASSLARGGAAKGRGRGVSARLGSTEPTGTGAGFGSLASTGGGTGSR